MANSLLTICQRAIRRIPGFAVPGSIVTNTDDDVAQRLWECAQDTGEELVRDYRWQKFLTDSYTFTTVDGTAEYDLPSDIKQWVNQTWWDRSNQWPLRGPASGMEWQTLNSGIVSSGIRYWFRVAGDKIIIYPTPGGAYTLAFDYYHKNWCESVGGTGQSEWEADDDVPRLPGHLFVLGTRYYFKRTQGLPYEDDETDYYNAITAEQYNDTPKSVIDMTGRSLVSEHPGLPETGFGS